MFLRFSEEVQKLLLLSLKEKNRLRDSFIGTEHIFLGILSMKKNSVCELLNSFNITYEVFSSFFIKKDNDIDNYFVFSPLVRDIFKSISLDKKNSEVMITDIVFEILSDPSSKVVYVFRKLNVDIKSLLKMLNISKKKGIKKGILNELGINLNDKNKDDVLIGRDEEINDIINILCCKNKNNPILIGDAGVGKTAIIEELARRIENGDVPFKLRNKKIFSVSMASLVSGTKYRGEFEEKINKLINEVENNEDIILFIDEIHTLVGAGGADGAIDASNILKPSLARGNIKIIGATTKDEYNKYFSGDKALSRRFRIVLCEEPSISKTKDILLGIKDIYEGYHVIISDSILEKIVNFSNVYIKNKKFPDKAIDILDEVCVLASFESNKDYCSITRLDKELNNLIDLKNKSLISNDFKKAIEYSHEENKIHMLISRYQKKLYNVKKDIIVSDKNLMQVMENKTNIPFYSYNYRFKDINNNINKYMRNSIFSRDVSNMIGKYTLNLYSSLISNGINNSLWILSKNSGLNDYFISSYLNDFFKKNNVIYIDLNNYRNIDDLVRDKFVEKIKLYPFSILVISNYNDIDLSIKDFFDRVNNYGFYIDKNNEKIEFSNCLFIYSVVESSSIGFNKNNVNDNYINIDNIDLSKLCSYVKNVLVKENIFLSYKDISKISNIIISDYNNFYNLDYLIKKEGKYMNKSNNKERTMKV